MQPWALVTPASRGIGLEFARRLLATTKVPVVATARKDLDQTRENVLDGLKDVDEDRLNVLHLDFLDESTIESAASTLSTRFPTQTHTLHLALCLPGILHPEKSPAQISADDALATFRINTLSHLLLLKHLSPFLPRKKTALPFAETLVGLPTSHATWAAMSARVGSISDNSSVGGWYSYRASKAGVNQIVKTFDNYLRMSAGERAVAVGMHPGTVKTGLSREFWAGVPEGKLFEVGFAVEKLMEVVNGVGVEGRGRCWDWKGEEVLP